MRSATGGTISAWMATSEGASYIPLGVRIPQEVRLSVTDPIVGHELWNASAEAGGADPLEIVVRQAEAREQAAPGARVLALASSLPMGHVIDWAGAVSARPVSVNPREVERSTGVDLSVLSGPGWRPAKSSGRPGSTCRCCIAARSPCRGNGAKPMLLQSRIV